MKEKEEIGKMLFESRKKKKLKQQDLARILHVSDKTISTWETGKHSPDLETIKKIEEILDIKIIERIDYMKNKQKRFFTIFIVIILVLALISNVLYLIHNSNNYQVYTLESQSSQYILRDSYIIISNNKLLIKLNELENLELPYQPKYKVTITYNEKCEECTIANLNDYKNYSIQVDHNSKLFKEIKDSKIYLIIEYKDYKNNQVEKIIELKRKKISFQKNIEKNTINLLKNNGYHQVSTSTYEKINNNEIYRYDLLLEKLYYEKKENGLSYYATIDKSLNKSYCVMENNTIIEYNIKNKSYQKKYKNNIYEKLKEINKIKISE